MTTRLDDFHIGDFCSNGSGAFGCDGRAAPKQKTYRKHGIVTEVTKLHCPKTGNSRNKAIKIRWQKDGKTREVWYSHGQNFWWLDKIEILAKAKGLHRKD